MNSDDDSPFPPFICAQAPALLAALDDSTGSLQEGHVGVLDEVLGKAVSGINIENPSRGNVTTIYLADESDEQGNPSNFRGVFGDVNKPEEPISSFDGADSIRSTEPSGLYKVDSGDCNETLRVLGLDQVCADDPSSVSPITELCVKDVGDVKQDSSNPVLSLTTSSPENLESNSLEQKLLNSETCTREKDKSSVLTDAYDFQSGLKEAIKGNQFTCETELLNSKSDPLLNLTSQSKSDIMGSVEKSVIHEDEEDKNSNDVDKANLEVCMESEIDNSVLDVIGDTGLSVEDSSVTQSSGNNSTHILETGNCGNNSDILERNSTDRLDEENRSNLDVDVENVNDNASSTEIPAIKTVSEASDNIDNELPTSDSKTDIVPDVTKSSSPDIGNAEDPHVEEPSNSAIHESDNVDESKDSSAYDIVVSVQNIDDSVSSDLKDDAMVIMSEANTIINVDDELNDSKDNGIVVSEEDEIINVEDDDESSNLKDNTLVVLNDSDKIINVDEESNNSEDTTIDVVSDGERIINVDDSESSNLKDDAVIIIKEVSSKTSIPCNDLKEDEKTPVEANDEYFQPLQPSSTKSDLIDKFERDECHDSQDVTGCDDLKVMPLTNEVIEEASSGNINVDGLVVSDVTSGQNLEDEAKLVGNGDSSAEIIDITSESEMIAEPIVISNDDISDENEEESPKYDEQSSRMKGSSVHENIHKDEPFVEENRKKLSVDESDKNELLMIGIQELPTADLIIGESSSVEENSTQYSNENNSPNISPNEVKDDVWTGPILTNVASLSVAKSICTSQNNEPIEGNNGKNVPARYFIKDKKADHSSELVIENILTEGVASEMVVVPDDGSEKGCKGSEVDLEAALVPTQFIDEPGLEGSAKITTDENRDSVENLIGIENGSGVVNIISENSLVNENGSKRKPSEELGPSNEELDINKPSLEMHVSPVSSPEKTSIEDTDMEDHSNLEVISSHEFPEEYNILDKSSSSVEIVANRHLVQQSDDTIKPNEDTIGSQDQSKVIEHEEILEISEESFNKQTVPDKNGKKRSSFGDDQNATNKDFHDNSEKGKSIQISVSKPPDVKKQVVSSSQKNIMGANAKTIVSGQQVGKRVVQLIPGTSSYRHIPERSMEFIGKASHGASSKQHSSTPKKPFVMSILKAKKQNAVQVAGLDNKLVPRHSNGKICIKRTVSTVAKSPIQSSKSKEITQKNEKSPPKLLPLKDSEKVRYLLGRSVASSMVKSSIQRVSPSKKQENAVGQSGFSNSIGNRTIAEKTSQPGRSVSGSVVQSSIQRVTLSGSEEENSVSQTGSVKPAEDKIIDTKVLQGSTGGSNVEKSSIQLVTTSENKEEKLISQSNSVKPQGDVRNVDPVLKVKKISNPFISVEKNVCEEKELDSIDKKRKRTEPESLEEFMKRYGIPPSSKEGNSLQRNIKSQESIQRDSKSDFQEQSTDKTIKSLVNKLGPNFSVRAVGKVSTNDPSSSKEDKQTETKINNGAQTSVEVGSAGINNMSSSDKASPGNNMETRKRSSNNNLTVSDNMESLAQKLGSYCSGVKSVEITSGDEIDTPQRGQVETARGGVLSGLKRRLSDYWRKSTSNDGNACGAPKKPLLSNSKILKLANKGTNVDEPSSVEQPPTEDGKSREVQSAGLEDKGEMQSESPDSVQQNILGKESSKIIDPEVSLTKLFGGTLCEESPVLMAPPEPVEEDLLEMLGDGPRCSENSSSNQKSRDGFEKELDCKSVDSLDNRKSVDSLDNRKSVDSLDNRKSVDSLEHRKSVDSSDESATPIRKRRRLLDDVKPKAVREAEAKQGTTPDKSLVELQQDKRQISVSGKKTPSSEDELSSVRRVSGLVPSKMRSAADKELQRAERRLRYMKRKESDTLSPPTVHQNLSRKQRSPQIAETRHKKETVSKQDALRTAVVRLERTNMNNKVSSNSSVKGHEQKKPVKVNYARADSDVRVTRHTSQLYESPADVRKTRQTSQAKAALSGTRVTRQASNLYESAYPSSGRVTRQSSSHSNEPLPDVRVTRQTSQSNETDARVTRQASHSNVKNTSTPITSSREKKLKEKINLSNDRHQSEPNQKLKPNPRNIPSPPNHPKEPSVVNKVPKSGEENDVSDEATDHVRKKAGASADLPSSVEETAKERNREVGVLKNASRILDTSASPNLLLHHGGKELEITSEKCREINPQQTASPVLETSSSTSQHASRSRKRKLSATDIESSESELLNETVPFSPNRSPFTESVQVGERRVVRQSWHKDVKVSVIERVSFSNSPPPPLPSFSYKDLKRNVFEVKLPSSLWATQVETNGRFVSFSRLASNSNSAHVSMDKAVLFMGTCEPAVFFHERRLNLPVEAFRSLEEVSEFLRKVHSVAFCRGTGLPQVTFASQCLGYVDESDIELRCSQCALYRKKALALCEMKQTFKQVQV